MTNVSGVDGNGQPKSRIIAGRLDLKDGKMDAKISKEIWNEFAGQYGMETTTDEDGINRFAAEGMIDTMIKNKATQDNKAVEDVETEVLNSKGIATPQKTLPDVMVFSGEREQLRDYVYMAMNAGYSDDEVKNMKFLHDRTVLYDYIDKNGKRQSDTFEGEILKIGNDYFQSQTNEDGTSILYKVTKIKSGLKTYYCRDLPSEESKKVLENFKKENAEKAAKKAEEERAKEVKEAKENMSTAADGLSSTDSNKLKQALESLQDNALKLDLPTHQGMTKTERDNIPSYNEYLANGSLDKLENGQLVKIIQSGDPNNPNDGGKIIYGIFVKDNNGNSYLLREAGNKDENLSAYNVYSLQGENSYLEYDGQNKPIGQIGVEDNEKYVTVS